MGEGGEEGECLRTIYEIGTDDCHKSSSVTAQKRLSEMYSSNHGN